MRYESLPLHQIQWPEIQETNSEPKQLVSIIAELLARHMEHINSGIRDQSETNMQWPHTFTHPTEPEVILRDSQVCKKTYMHRSIHTYKNRAF